MLKSILTLAFACTLAINAHPLIPTTLNDDSPSQPTIENREKGLDKEKAKPKADRNKRVQREKVPSPKVKKEAKKSCCGKEGCDCKGEKPCKKGCCGGCEKSNKSCEKGECPAGCKDCEKSKKVAAKSECPSGCEDCAKDTEGKANVVVPADKVADEAVTSAKASPKPSDAKPAKISRIEAAKKEQEELAILNALAAEKQKFETNKIRGEIALLKLEKEQLSEKIALAALKEQAQDIGKIAAYEVEKEQLNRDATLAKIRAEHFSAQLKELQASSALETTAMMAEISKIEVGEKRGNYANAEPLYLDDPFQKDGTLVVSDRRIPFNGPVTSQLADRVTERINYFNNKDAKKPIFIVIDESPGGSVMAGYQILRAMEGSEAPVYVVVKSFAASMAAAVTTLAERSFVYPNAIILHHQISQSFAFSKMNLTEQKENVDALNRWWERLAGPISKKMGVSTDRFIEMMYEKAVSGDWSEFGDEAVKLKWADHVVTRVQETALLKNPDASRAAPTVVPGPSGMDDYGLIPAVDAQGTPYMILPRKNPLDAYLIHNPDGYYRFQ